MLKEKFLPENALEKAVIEKDNAAIVKLIADGAQLTRPDVLAEKEAFCLRYSVAVLLLEATPCLRSGEAVKRLEELSAHPEMVDLVKELTQELPENTHPQSDELLAALTVGDDLAVANLVDCDDVSICNAPMSAFDNMDEFCKFTVENLFDRGLDVRLKAQLFKHLHDKVKEGNTPRAELYFEMMKIIIGESESPVRNNRIHTLWRQHTAPAFVKDIEAFDAKAVFELLAYSCEYEERVNWELVNRTAKASDYLEFLGEHEWYADRADWRMINVQAEPEDWLNFLGKQPGLINSCQDHAALYLYDPECWENILQNSGLPPSNCFAYLENNDGESEWESCFKVRIVDGRAEFFEVNDLYSYKKFAELARNNFETFAEMLQNCDGNGRFVNIIR